MAKIRIGLGSEFNLKDQKVGLGTNNPQERLDVADVAKGKDLKVTGISSFTAYEGFLRADHQIAENTTLSFDQGPSASLSGEIIVGTGVTVTVTGVGLGTTTVGNGSGTITNTIETTDVTRAGGSEVECLKVYNTFTPPSGGTNERPYAPKPGELYYNYDFKTIEFFDGYGWRQVDNTTRSGRGVFAGGRAPGATDRMDYITISTLGNAQDFGDLTAAHSHINGVASSTRGLIGINGGNLNYFTIASKGNGIQFGTYENAAGYGSASSSTRGLFAGGYNPGANQEIEYVEIATLGNALDFGNLFTGKYYLNGVSNGTRASFGGGFIPGPAVVSRIESVIISSKGNAIKFGDLSMERCQGASVCNSVRGIFAGGFDPVPSPGFVINLIDYVTIATEGTATYFGDCTASLGQRYGGCSSQTRGVYGGGATAPAFDPTNIMEYVTISTAGNAIDFGDLPLPTRANAGVSDSHGGLGGF